MTGVREEEAAARLAERFEEHRARLRGVAYRMLGSLDEADDVGAGSLDEVQRRRCR